MTEYRFFPLLERPNIGILKLPTGKIRVAKFIRRNQESERAQRNLKFVASSVNGPTLGEAAKP